VDALRRGYAVLRSEVERAVRPRLQTDRGAASTAAAGAMEAHGTAATEAVRVPLGIIERAEAEGVRA
jgi:hypothetical protein